MRRICSGCGEEYRHEAATARVDELFLMACSGRCLCAMLHTAFCDCDDEALLEREDLQESLAQMRRGEGEVLVPREPINMGPGEV